MKGYLGLALIASPYMWGSWHTDNEISSNTVAEASGKYHSRFRVGGSLSGYRVMKRFLHLGAFFSIDFGKMVVEFPEWANDEADNREDENLSLQSSLGFALKVGGKSGKRSWVGFGFDTGLALVDQDLKDTEVKPQIGMVFFPKVLLDVVLFSEDASPKVVSLFFGPQIGVAFGDALKSTDKVETTWLWLMLTVGIGFNIGIGA